MDSTCPAIIVYTVGMKNTGFSSADVLLPKKGIDLGRWATVACDQFTSDPAYWKKVEEIVSDAPSTLRITLPEIYLEQDGKEDRIAAINRKMKEYMDEGIFTEYPDSYILVERRTGSGTRFGIVGKIDLEEYDYSPTSRSLVRATEGTILSRIPPRKEIRMHAPLELPHIMILISDRCRSVIEPVAAERNTLEVVYDTDLMMNGGHITGYLVSQDKWKKTIENALSALYETLDRDNPLLFAMGDGNHSLATAKSIWEDIKKGLTEDELKAHPARYALVEIENIYDPGLEFEPIHRVFFGLDRKLFHSTLMDFVSSADTEEIGKAEIREKVNMSRNSFVLFDGESYTLYRLYGTKKELAAWTVQSVIDRLLSDMSCTVDYIHGMEETLQLGGNGNLSLILPDIAKETFFSSILSDSAFPRKTFSIGHAEEKRYYMEARRIR